MWWPNIAHSRVFGGVALDAGLDWRKVFFEYLTELAMLNILWRNSIRNYCCSAAGEEALSPSSSSENLHTERIKQLWTCSCFRHEANEGLIKDYYLGPEHRSSLWLWLKVHHSLELFSSITVGSRIFSSGAEKYKIICCFTFSVYFQSWWEWRLLLVFCSVQWTLLQQWAH